MFVACSTLCFSKHSLEDALRIIREMHFTKADLALHEQGPHLRPTEVAADVTRVAQKLKTANLPFAAFDFEPAQPFGADGRAHLRAVCRLARLLAVPVITIAAAPAGAEMQAEITRLTEWNKIAETEGVILTVDTRADTMTGEPSTAIELCRRVAGLGITLDPSHYLINQRGPQNYDALFPYVRHTKLRDSGSKPELFQVRVGQGELEYGRIVTQLERYKYDRTLTVDIRDVPDNPFPVEPEVRKLKYLLESLV